MDDIYKIIEEYNPIKKRKMLIVFDDENADMVSKRNLIQQLLNYLTEVES